MQLRSGRSIKTSSSKKGKYIAKKDNSSVSTITIGMKLRSGRIYIKETNKPTSSSSLNRIKIGSYSFENNKDGWLNMMNNYIHKVALVHHQYRDDKLSVQSKKYYVESARVILELFGTMNKYFEDIKKKLSIKFIVLTALDTASRLLDQMLSIFNMFCDNKDDDLYIINATIGELDKFCNEANELKIKIGVI